MTTATSYEQHGASMGSLGRAYQSRTGTSLCGRRMRRANGREKWEIKRARDSPSSGSEATPMPNASDDHLASMYWRK